MSEEKTIRILPFSGLKKDWRKWQAKFIAKARIKGYYQILVGNEVAPRFDAVQDNTEVGKANKLLLKANEVGFATLMFAMESEVCLSMVESSITNEQPEGCLRTAWKKLCKKFEPTTKLALTDLKKEFQERHLEVGEDPDEWILDLERINFRLERDFKKKIDEDDMTIHILNNIDGDDYDNVIEKLENKIGDPNNPLTMDELQEAMQSRYGRLQKKEQNIGNYHEQPL